MPPGGEFCISMLGRENNKIFWIYFWIKNKNLFQHIAALPSKNMRHFGCSFNLLIEQDFLLHITLPKLSPEFSVFLKGACQAGEGQAGPEGRGAEVGRASQRWMLWAFQPCCFQDVIFLFKKSCLKTTKNCKDRAVPWPINLRLISTSQKYHYTPYMVKIQ